MPPLPVSPLPVWSEELRVKAYETDFRNRWKPHCLHQALQEAASNHAANLGYGYVEMHARGMAWVLSRIKIRFQAMPLMGAQVRLRTWPRGIQQRLFFTRDFDLLQADGTPLAQATSAWVLIDPARRRILPPNALSGDLPFHAESALDEPLEKLIPPENLQPAGTHRVGFSDVDPMGHANSASYLAWILDGLPFEDHRLRRLDWIQINYSNEVKPGEDLAVSLGPGAEGDSTGVWYAQGTIVHSGLRAFDAALGWKEE